MRVLIAEDEPFYRCLLEGTLREWGYEVVAVADGAAAWEALRRPDAPKLAVLDWQMPGLDGLEVCRRVRAAASPEPTYVIMLTAREGRANTLAALRAGADDFVTKPFDREELQVRLQAGARVVGLQTSLAARVVELESALSRAAKMEAIGRLVGGVAHDFNNLLCVINGFGEMVLHKMPPRDPRSELLKEICKAGERAATLTGQLLAFSRNNSLSPVALDINGVITEFAKMLRRLVPEDLRLSFDLAPDTGCVVASPGQLEQVIMNLVVNARDAMPGGGSITIQTRRLAGGVAAVPGRPELPPGDHAELTVSDTGCGMDEATRSRIFEPFFTTKEVGKGTGLGLATVSGIIKQLGGHLGVSSNLGVGTTFRAYLPSAPAPSLAPRPLSEGAVSPSNGETVLVAEDDQDVRTLIRCTLEACGYKVLTSRNGEEALALARGYEGHVHALITDVVMPGVNGYELAAGLRQLRGDVSVLFVSGYDGDVFEDIRAVTRIDGFLQKPFTPISLSRKLHEILSRADETPPVGGDEEAIDADASTTNR